MAVAKDKALCIVAVITLAISSQPVSFGAEFYVDATNGNDGNDGLSPSSAWQTISRVNSASFDAGDSVLFKKGEIWREQLIIPSSGEAGNPVVYGAYGEGDRPLIKGSHVVSGWTASGQANVWRATLGTLPRQVFFNEIRGTLEDASEDLNQANEWYWSSSVIYVYSTSDPDNAYVNPGIEASLTPSDRAHGLVHVQDCEHVVVQDIEAAQSNSFGIYVKPPAHQITVDNCNANYALDGGIVVPQAGGNAATDITIQYCISHHNNGGYNEGEPGVATYHEGVTMELTDGFTIRGCEVYANYMEGINIKRGARNGVIENNRVYGNDIINIYHDGASDIEIRYNWIYDCTYNAGIELGLETDTYGNDNINIHHNLFWGNANGFSMWSMSSVAAQTRNINVYNNTFFNNENAILWKSGVTDHYGGDNNIKNNIFWQNREWYYAIKDDTTEDQALSRTAVAFNVFQQGSNTETAGTDAVVVSNPQFVDSSAANFHLQSDSPCIDVGTDLGFIQDFDGNLVPQGGAPDIGAYEYASSPLYTLTVTASHGTVSKTPNKASYTHGETVTVEATPDAGYSFANWSGDLTGSSNPATLVMDADKSVTANFAKDNPDKAPPVLGNRTPEPDSIQVPLNSLVTLQISDEGEGVDPASVAIEIDGNIIYSGDVAQYDTQHGTCRRTGTNSDYTYVFQSQEGFDFSRQVAVTVNARDLAGNVMPEQTYSFATEMYSFGQNRKVCLDQDGLNKAQPGTAVDGNGDIWVAWQAGSRGQKHVYVCEFSPDSGTYGTAVQLSQGLGGHCNPDIAIGKDGLLCVVWQEDTRGIWDVTISTSADGTTWSSPRRIVDSNDNQINPVVTTGLQSGSPVAAAWQDDRSGNQDVYVALSTDAFLTSEVSAVTADNSDQAQPAIAIDSEDVVVLLWTDARNGSTDIYGAASNSGPWTNVPVVTGEGNESHPAVAVGPTSSTLHILWVDDVLGHLDILSASSQGLPTSPVAGTRIIDDSSGADQRAPAIEVVAGENGRTKVFAGWEDYRNVAASGDTDLYFADLSSGSTRTNVLVGDDGTNTDQSQPALGIDSSGYPYLVWTDHGTTNTDIYYAGATFMAAAPLAAEQVDASSGAVVGTQPENVDTLEDVSVVVPAEAFPHNVTVTISRISNPQAFAVPSLSSYDFGPSGIQFSRPVTITIPYDPRDAGQAVAYWYDSGTGVLSQQGITDIKDITITPQLHALQFKTTHFTAFYLLSGSGIGTAVAGSGGGGGGCSLSVHRRGDLCGYFLPYAVLAVIMAMLRLRDGKHRTG